MIRFILTGRMDTELLYVLIHKSPLFPITLKKQSEHHKEQTFKEEYLQFMEKFEIEYNKQYLFDRID